MKNSAGLEPEFSYPLYVDKIPTAGLDKSIEVDEEACRRLMKRFDLLGLSNLSADLEILVKRAGKAVSVMGRLTADVVQKCGLTTEPVPDHISHPIEVLYSSEPEEHGSQNFVEPEETDIEPLENGTIDLGELIAQNLGIALNPYPRKAGAVFLPAEPEVVVTLNPLARLAELTKSSKDKSK